ncbi:MAG: Do family serine endopeptidase [Planctomycetaceae bacterium]|nr:Do family serine endopeptidase [Planctomycetaceae bacterium]MCA9109011.1 Do family serine endopeptidase [Planctomycetaceae bacterium]
MKKLKNHYFGALSAIAGVCVIAAAVAVAQQQLHVPDAGPGVQHAEALSFTFRNVAKAVLPAVVSIETRSKAVHVNQPGGRSPFEDEFFKRFFGENNIPEEYFQQRQMPQQRGSGSGFIIDGSGIILTNAHVVEDAERVIVKLEDGRELTATEWQADPRSDVAIVRVDAGEALPSMAMGDSDQMEIGDWVLALGNPFDIGTTVTSGIISAKQRNTGINERESYLQTDAAINPGNSGGPLVNLRGEVVGINTAISTRSGGYDGVGFAIPINNARWVANQLIDHGAVKRAYLGVRLQEMNPRLREQFNVPNGHGTLVADVMAGTPASAAGMEPGDVVLNFAGNDVRNSTHLQGIVEQLSVGETYPMTVLRNGNETTLNVTVQEMPGDYTAAMRRSDHEEDQPEGTPEFNKLGLEIASLDSSSAEKYSIDSSVKGVLVTSVEPGSPAAQAGLRAGDVIERVGGNAVASPEEYDAAAADQSLDQGVVLLVRRGDGSLFVVVGAE